MARNGWRTDNPRAIVGSSRMLIRQHAMELSLANASEQFRQSDVTRWAIVALVCAGLAVLAANVSALLPKSMLEGLHLTRLDGASVADLSSLVDDIEEELRTLRQENRQLLSRFALHEEESNNATRRIGALEVTLPHLLEVASSGTGVDASLPTASIGAPQGEVIEAEGGTAVVTRTPLDPAPTAAPQPIPEPIETTASLPPFSDVKFGIAIGSAVPHDQAPAAWEDLSLKLGPLLLGLEPLLADGTVGDDKYIIAGPLEQMTDATNICGRLERVSIPCQPMPYKGTPFPQ
jgi:hypothetical protein